MIAADAIARPAPVRDDSTAALATPVEARAGNRASGEEKTARVPATLTKHPQPVPPATEWIPYAEAIEDAGGCFSPPNP